ncbi:TPA: hypothetical protein ACGTRQ_003817 [Vibrio parahaemolyticus]
MASFNTYQQKLNQLVIEAKERIDILGFKDETGAFAHWDSRVWDYTKEGQVLRFYFIRNTRPGTLTSAYIQSQPLLTQVISDILKLYVLEVITKNIAPKTMYGRYQNTRRFLMSMNSLSDLTPDALFMHCETINKPEIGTLKLFVNWLNDTLFGHMFLPSIKQENNKNTGAEILAKRHERLPDIKVIMALGAITYDTITGVSPAKWRISPLDNQRDAYICAMGALAMAAPNRVAAEQTVLKAQSLQRERQYKREDERSVYWLDWIGSKGYADHQKHILESMADCVDICLTYVNKATSSMRKMACFFIDPTLPLKHFLTKEDVEPLRWHKVEPDLNKPTNMVVLGYLLGFYSDTEATIRVQKGTFGASQERLAPSGTHKRRWNQLGTQAAKPWLKPLWAIEAHDMLVFSETAAARFLGLENRFQGYKKTGLHGIMSVREAQTRWIEYITQILGGDLTRLRNHSKNGQCDLRSMLFAFNGQQLLGSLGKAGFIGGKSPFFPIGPKSLANLFSGELKKGGIFSRHGFSSAFHISPHQFRHLLTTIGSEQGMVNQILNMWGGRQDPKQLLHYVHSDPKTASSQIGDIMFADSPTLKEAKKQVRLATQLEYEEAVGLAASITSTGVCTQQLIYKPCDFFNNFESQCFMCESSCHVAHDCNAIDVLQRDLINQQQRLDRVSQAPHFSTRSNMQSWYQIHSQQTAILQQLLNLMTSDSVKPGSLIRLLMKEGNIHISDLKARTVRVEPLCLPHIDLKLDDQAMSSADGFLDNLFSEL